MREGGPLAIADVAAAGLDASSLGPAITSLLAVPLADGERVIGSIHVGTLTRRDFDDETIALLRLAADRAGLAIARTRLYERERRIAQELQRSLLPKRLPPVPGVALDARYLPGVNGTTVGGDWYDAIALPSGRVAIAIGDVVGRGISAAATMGQMRSALRAILMQADHTGAMADRLNRFAHALGPGGGDDDGRARDPRAGDRHAALHERRPSAAAARRARRQRPLPGRPAVAADGRARVAALPASTRRCSSRARRSSSTRTGSSRSPARCSTSGWSACSRRRAARATTSRRPASGCSSTASARPRATPTT